MRLQYQIWPLQVSFQMKEVGCCSLSERIVSQRENDVLLCWHMLLVWIFAIG